MSTKLPSGGRFLDNPDDEPGVRVMHFIGRNIIVIIAVLAFLVTFIVVSSVSSSRSLALQQKDSAILALKQENKSEKASVDESYSEIVRKATGGVDLEHKNRDDATVEEMLRMALNWNGLREYLTARDNIMQNYGFAEDSQFMTVFMPGEMQGIARKAPDGTMHYAYDTDLSNSYEGMTSYVTNVNGDVYSYVALVTMRTKSSTGDTSAPGYFRLTYDVVDGRISNIFAETAPNGVKGSN